MQVLMRATVSMPDGASLKDIKEVCSRIIGRLGVERQFTLGPSMSPLYSFGQSGSIKDRSDAAVSPNARIPIGMRKGRGPLVLDRFGCLSGLAVTAQAEM